MMRVIQIMPDRAFRDELLKERPSVREDEARKADEWVDPRLDRIWKFEDTEFDEEQDRIAALVEVGAIPYRERYQVRHVA